MCRKRDCQISENRDIPKIKLGRRAERIPVQRYVTERHTRRPTCAGKRRDLQIKENGDKGTRARPFCPKSLKKCPFYFPAFWQTHENKICKMQKSCSWATSSDATLWIKMSAVATCPCSFIRLSPNNPSVWHASFAPCFCTQNKTRATWPLLYLPLWKLNWCHVREVLVILAPCLWGLLAYLNQEWVVFLRTKFASALTNEQGHSSQHRGLSQEYWTRSMENPANRICRMWKEAKPFSILCMMHQHKTG